mgnify:CR=1 FL=1
MTLEIRAKIGRKGKDNLNYKGGWLGDDGHIRIGKILRSHIVWDARHPDNPVKPREVIHHLNGNPSDDRPENLIKLLNQNQHAHLHHAGRPHSSEHIQNQADAQQNNTDKRRGFKPCENCGILLTRQQMRDRGRFCSPSCHYLFRKGKGRKGW